MVGIKNFGRVLVFVAHPDDETIACGGLLQRARASLVVFAVDGAPPRYGFERRFGSLQNYSTLRFHEAATALGMLRDCSFRRLSRNNGACFVDQHLFLDLSEAFTSLYRTIQEFSPDCLVSHAFEGGHLDHDACHVLAAQSAVLFGLRVMEFPLYWRTREGPDIFQRFRDERHGELVLQLSPEELVLKQRMLAAYQTQRGITSVFQVNTERFRPMLQVDCTRATWTRYPFENRWRPLKANVFFAKVAQFQQAAEAGPREQISS